MLLEISGRPPYVRRRRDLEVLAPHRQHLKSSRHGTPHHAHRSWVMTEHGKGWIHHHDLRGYTIEYPDGRLLLCKTIRNLSPLERDE